MKAFKKTICGCLSAAMFLSALTVAPASVQGAALKLNKTSATMTVGKKLTLKVKNLAKDTAVKWSSSKKTVAAVSAKGVVTAKSAGKATIKAVVSQKTLTCKITVKDDPAANPDTDPVATDPTADNGAKDISALLAGKSYKGTAATPAGNIDAMQITFGSDGTATGSKMNETTMLPEQFSGTYQATLSGKNVTITVDSNGKTFSETLTVESEDFSKLSASKKIMGMDIVIQVELVPEA